MTEPAPEKKKTRKTQAVGVGAKTCACELNSTVEKHRKDRSIIDVTDVKGRWTLRRKQQARK